jgi:hypothetical protein
MIIILGEMIRNTALAGVDICPAQFFGSDILARGGFDERRAAEKNCPRAFDNDGLIAHRRDVRAARRAAAHDRRDLRNALGRHARLIVKNASEVMRVGEDLILQRQIRAARIDEIQTGQMIFLGDLLRAQMLFDGHRKIRTAFDGGVVGNDHHFAVGDPSDAGDDARAG